MNYLITNVHILTMDTAMTEYPRGSIAVRDGRIAAVGNFEITPEYMDYTVIDGDGAMAVPGFINAHTHSGMIPFRSLGDDCPDRLRRFLFPLENEAMTPELASLSARYACAEMLLAGTTCFVDMYYFEDHIARAVQQMGMRAFLGETVIGQPCCDSPEPHGGLEYGERFIREWAGDPLITPIIAPHATNTNSPEKIRESFELSQKYNVPMSMHVSEMDYEVTYFKEKFGKTPIAFLESLGVLSPQFIAAHCILAEEGDIEILARTGTAVAHCIGANTKSGKGVAPVKAMLASGVPVALGTDGPSSGNTLDTFTQFDLFAKFHKTANRDRALFPASEIVRLATSGAAKALGIHDSVGSLEPGKKADITLVETKSANMFPVFDPYAVLVYSAKSANVDTVFVDGRLLVRGKILTGTPLEIIREDLSLGMADFSGKAKILAEQI
ncbi:amidohydrolase [Breznakiella homolactica]|uniref:Amidohydrolase n=1 Tax=Breznakiella homolactica TaxID=2798577 RepID=A0A7T7XKV5_9SPIR|nr:amidohydrolase [Breznakiella homolactica]QQO08259.1 amidohydrolase [Breznakiella homolactica]